MQPRIEPPVLLSRLLVFVFAGTVVVLFAMFLTMEKMFPLNRPQVFFLTSKTSYATVQITEMPPTDNNLEAYKKAFVMEYVRARNEVSKNLTETRKKWGNNGGVVSSWSTQDVYEAFRKTGLYNIITAEYSNGGFECFVDFDENILQIQPNLYQVKIRYRCEYNSGHVQEKNYTLNVKISENYGQDMEWIERMSNPLGIRVSEYVVNTGDGDPLDTIYK
ncbi:MAG: type IV secretion system protein [Alphaproteobacteria bacterium]|nr:type IV secretion system protein [Alphaproteobacteria bacterium]